MTTAWSGQQMTLSVEPPQQRILVLAIETKPLGEVLTISGANWSVAVAVPADYTRYMNQPYIYVGKWEKLSSTAGRAILAGGQSVPTPRMQNLVLPIQCAHQAAPSRRALRLLASRAIGCTEASCGHHSAIAYQRRQKRSPPR